jgi:DNA-binding IclR family transcriptional regulator
VAISQWNIPLRETPVPLAEHFWRILIHFEARLMETTVVAPPLTEAAPRSSDLYQLHSLDRAVSVLEMLGQSETALSLAEVCQRLQLHKSTAHRSLMVLERSALIERTPENRYRLGMKLYELGNRAVEQVDLRTRVHPYFRRLAAQVGETVHLSVLQKTSIVYLDKVEPNRRVCVSSKTGTSNPVYCTSMGKAMLAFQPPEMIEQIISRIHFVRYTPKTLTSKDALMKALERVRRRGYAIDDQEIEVGVRCVGAPIFDENRQAIAAVSVSGPISRITAATMPEIADHLLRCCRDISLSLGLQGKKRPRVLSAFERQYQG